MPVSDASPRPDYDYAVIIPHYNDVIRLERCLSALMASGVPGAEVVVADNGSTQPLDALKARFPAVRFVTEPQAGAAMARNRGVAETTAPVLFFIDADCVPAPDWFATACEVWRKGDLVGGRVDVFDETPPPRSGAEAFEAVFAFDMESYVRRQGFTGSGNLLTRRSVFEDVGGFRPGVSEDRDWCERAVARGYRLVYEDRLAVSHPSRQDWPALREKWRKTTRELFALTGASGPRARARWALRGLAMPASALLHAPRILTSPRLDTPGERARALATLFRLRMVRGIWMLRQSLGGTI